MKAVVDKLAELNHPLHDIVVVDLNTGLRRGALGLRLSDVDLDEAVLRVKQSLVETWAGGLHGLRFKEPKTKHGKRTISLPPVAVAVLRERRRKILETRMALGLGKPDADTLYFAEPDGSPIGPNCFTLRWRDACVALDLPRVHFHALRHTHASVLIARHIDIVQISRGLGHRNPTVTLNICAHPFKPSDRAAADAMQEEMTGST